MSDDERRLLRLIAAKPESRLVRDVIARSDVPARRCWYWLQKWIKKGWYDYGVTLDLGWLTDAGLAAAGECSGHER